MTTTQTKRRLSLLSGLLFFCAATSITAEETHPPGFKGYDTLQGKTYRGNLMRTGEYDASGAPSLSSIAWSFDTGDNIVSSPLAVDGLVYIGSINGKMFALHEADGTEAWSFQAKGEIIGSPTVAGNTLFFTSRDGQVYALDAQTGKTKWDYTFKPNKAYKHLYASPAIAYGTVFIPGHDGREPFEQPGWGAMPGIGLDVLTGQQVWRQKEGRSPQTFSSCFTILPNTIILAQSWAFVNTINLESGMFQLESKPNCTLGNGGITGAIAARNGKYYAIERLTGDQNGCEPIGTVMVVDQEKIGKYYARYSPTFPTITKGKKFIGITKGVDMMYNAAPAVTDTAMFVCCNTGALYALDATDPKKELWTAQLGGKLMSAPSVASNIIYLGCNDGKTYAVNATDGSIAASIEIGGSHITSSPYIGDGVVYIGSDNGKLFALK